MSRCTALDCQRLKWQGRLGCIGYYPTRCGTRPRWPPNRMQTRTKRRRRGRCCHRFENAQPILHRRSTRLLLEEMDTKPSNRHQTARCGVGGKKEQNWRNAFLTFSNLCEKGGHRTRRKKIYKKNRACYPSMWAMRCLQSPMHCRWTPGAPQPPLPDRQTQQIAGQWRCPPIHCPLPVARCPIHCP